jgi:glutathione synthase
MAQLANPDAPRSVLPLGDLDILFLRNDPALDVFERPWARLAGVNFGRMAAGLGVIVLNDPVGLNHAINKMYLQEFPSFIRPREIITRDRADLMAFLGDLNRPAVLKPLAGSGGRNVFLVRAEDRVNLNQIIETVLRESYVLAQDYVENGSRGDLRVFLWRGEILRCEGQPAILARHPAGADVRSNLTAGGTPGHGSLTPAVEAIAEAAGPKLRQDGLALVGLDIVEDKLIEINAFSPGGLVAISRLTGLDFSERVVIALEDDYGR